MRRRRRKSVAQWIHSKCFSYTFPPFCVCVCERFFFFLSFSLSAIKLKKLTGRRANRNSTFINISICLCVSSSRFWMENYWTLFCNFSCSSFFSIMCVCVWVGVRVCVCFHFCSFPAFPFRISHSVLQFQWHRQGWCWDAGNFPNTRYLKDAHTHPDTHIPRHTQMML